jgi:hypothetical protein
MTKEPYFNAEIILQKGKAFLRGVPCVFQKPFIGLPFLMWCYFIISYILLPNNSIWSGNLVDSDDFTYLSQTLDWLHGQSWFDNVQHRMSPPEGVDLHYTRLAEIPIAGMILLFRLFQYSWQTAALYASFTLPFIYLGILFYVLRVTAERFVSKDWSRLTAFTMVFAGAPLNKFTPGQVGHHSLETILTMGAIGLTAQMFAHPDRKRWAIAAGGVFAFAMAMALENLPWLALTSTVIGLWTIVSGAKAARSASIFGVALFLFGSLFLVIEKSPAEVFHTDLLAYSIAYVVFMGGVALALLGASGATFIKDIKLRFVVSGGIAAILGAIYLYQYPELLAGPYGAMDKRLAELFSQEITEMRSLVDRFDIYWLLLYLFIPVLSLIVALFMAREEKDSKKWNWILLIFLLTASVGLGLFYQSRVTMYADMFSIIPMVAFAERGCKWIRTHYEGRQCFWAKVFLVLLVGPLTVVFIPALRDGRSFNVGVMAFSAQHGDETCSIQGINGVLDASSYADRKLRIMNMMNLGAQLIFYTPHEVMAAPYHKNVRGNLDAVDFFKTSDPAQAKEIAQRDNIDLVVMCHHIPDIYFKGSESFYYNLPNGKLVKRLPDGSVVDLSSDESFVWQLASGKVPDWITPIPVPRLSNYSVFEVKTK